MSKQGGEDARVREVRVEGEQTGVVARGWLMHNGGVEGRMVVEGAHGDRYVAREACHRIGGEEQVRVRRY